MTSMPSASARISSRSSLTSRIPSPLVAASRPDRVPHVAGSEPPAAHTNLPLDSVTEAADRLRELSLPVACDARDPHDLAFPDRKRDVLHGGPAAVALDHQPVDLEQPKVGGRPGPLDAS